MRSVAEWIGRTDDEPVPARVRLRTVIFLGAEMSLREAARTTGLNLTTVYRRISLGIPGNRPHPLLSLDRIDNDRGYEPGNIRWATRQEQSLNRRRPYGGIVVKRREFTGSVRKTAWNRSGGKCEHPDCGKALSPGDIFYDHRIPNALGGEPTLDNCQVLCKAHHDPKTRLEDVPAIAKAKRRQAAHIGAKPKGRGFWRPPGTEYDWARGKYVRSGQ